MEKKSLPSHAYPHLRVKHITNPNRFYAFPILGFVVKIISIIPQAIELMILGIAAFVLVVLINPFVVLFSGKYWDPAYQLTVGIMKLGLKIYLFMYGLTNKYPGFDFSIHDDFTIDIPKPTHPNRFFAIPVLGGLARIIMIIPFAIYEGIIRYAAYLGAIGASFPVLFAGRYPESSYEIVRDSVRLNLAQSMYFSGLSDKYPNFWISMNHQTIKIILIILAVILMFGNGANAANSSKKYEMKYEKNGDPLRDWSYGNLKKVEEMQKRQQMMRQYNTPETTNLQTGY